jgi:hypothetical protein
MAEGFNRDCCLAEMRSGETKGSVAGTDVEQAHGSVAVAHKIGEFLTLLCINHLAMQECVVNPRMADKVPVGQER